MRESTTLQKSPRSAVLGRSRQRHLPSALHGQGAYVWDSEGKQYLDFSGSAAVNFIGHGVAEISAAIAEQMANLEFVHSSQFTTPVAEEYAQELLGFAGAKFRGGRVYFTSGGSESIETALKLARQYQVEIGQGKRYKILSRNQSYHGSTLRGACGVGKPQKTRDLPSDG
jgi:adenosylmethionine-8-amino-7-oxononanoate aminotransferase